ncbi:MAG: hypothetical protein QXQ88_00260 [archaeon]
MMQEIVFGVAGNIWNDLRIVFTIILFLFVYKWASDFIGSKKIGIILAAIISYFTFYLHPELIIWIIILFFGYAFLEGMAETLSEKAEKKEEKKEEKK